MKKFAIIALAGSIIVFGCSKQDVQDVQEEILQQESVVVENPLQFTANADESGDTKTVLNGTAVNWEENDEVKIFGVARLVDIR